MGRPSSYTQELANTICERIAKGESVRSICKDENLPDAGTIYNWLAKEGEPFVSFFKQYARAKDTQAELMFDELLEIADDGTNDWMTVNDRDVVDHEAINRSRLRVDTRKWYLSKVLPKKYGDKLDVMSDGKAIQGNTIILKDFSDGTSGK